MTGRQGGREDVPDAPAQPVPCMVNTSGFASMHPSANNESGTKNFQMAYSKRHGPHVPVRAFALTWTILK